MIKRKQQFGTWLAAAGACVALGLFSDGCTREKAPTGPLPLRVQLHAEPVSLDPALAEDGVALQIISNTMDGLVGYGPGGELENRIAQSYAVSDDGKRYVFTLKPQAKWSDGKTVRAQDFVAGIRRALDPKMGSKIAALLFPIRGAEAARKGKGPIDAIGVQASDDGSKLTVELDRPVPYILGALTLPVAMPVREEILATTGGKWTVTHPVTGAYRISSLAPGEKIVLERVPGYTRAGFVEGPEGFGTVELYLVRDESTGLNLFQQGKLDLLQRIPAYDFPRLKKEGLIVTSPFYATYYVAFNTRKAPFNERQWRRAAAGSIRKGEIVGALGTGEPPARSWIPDGIEGNIGGDPDPKIFADSVEWAKKHPLDPKAAPIPAGFDTSGRNSMIMEKVQGDLASAIGLKVSLSNMDWKSYVRSIQTDAPPIYRFAWLAPFRDPISHLKVFVTGSENNYAGWSDPEYDALVKEIDGMKPGPAREAKVKRAEGILVDREAVVVPLFHYVQSHLVSKKVGGFRANPFGVIHFATLKRLP